MDEPMRISVLPLPERSAPTATSFDTRPTSVKSWVDSLPMASVKESARKVYEALKEVNQLDIAPKQRFGLLEQMRQPVGHISGELERRYVGASFPLPMVQYRIASLNQKFQEVMATGYKLVLAGLLEPAPSLLKRLVERPMICTAVHRALRYMGQILLRSYQIYGPYPENTWREIHHLFQFASSLGCVDRRIRDDQYTQVTKTTAEEAYKQILLFALASPYRLRPGESTVVYRALEAWSSYCRLSRISEADNDLQGLFAIQPDTDQQPTYLELRTQHVGQTAWVLDTAELGALLRQETARLGDNTRYTPSAELPAGLSADLLARLMRSWGIMTERGSERQRQDGEIEIVLGFAAAHHALTALGSSPRTVKGEIPNRVELTIEDSTAAPWAVPTDNDSERIESYLCSVLDETPAGLRLQWYGDSRLKLTVGNLIALRRPDADSQSSWTLGVVRWMRSEQADSVQFGIQLLSGKPEPIAIQPRVAGRSSGRPVDGFRLIPEDQDIQPCLVAPGFLEHFDHPEVLLISQGTEQAFKLTRLIESTGVLAQFELEVMTVPAPQSVPETVDQETSFENLSELL